MRNRVITPLSAILAFCLSFAITAAVADEKDEKVVADLPKQVFDYWMKGGHFFEKQVAGWEYHVFVTAFGKTHIEPGGGKPCVFIETTTQVQLVDTSGVTHGVGYKPGDLDYTASPFAGITTIPVFDFSGGVAEGCASGTPVPTAAITLDRIEGTLGWYKAPAHVFVWPVALVIPRPKANPSDRDLQIAFLTPNVIARVPYMPKKPFIPETATYHEATATEYIDLFYPYFKVRVRTLRLSSALTVHINALTESATMVQTVPGTVPQYVYETRVIKVNASKVNASSGCTNPNEPAPSDGITAQLGLVITASIDAASAKIKFGPGPPVYPVEFEPAKVKAAFQEIRKLLSETLHASASVPAEQPHLLPKVEEQQLESRISLIDRYLAIDELFSRQLMVVVPGADYGPAATGKQGKVGRPLTAQQMFFVANIYAGLMQGPVPPVEGGFSMGPTWINPDRTPLIFSTQDEVDRLSAALRLCVVATRRSELQGLLMSYVKAVDGLLILVPGGTIAESMYTLTTGKELDGTHVGFLSRAMSAVNIAIQVSPIIGGFIKAGLVQPAFKAPLLQALNEQSILAKQLKAARGGIARTPKMIMGDWMKGYYAAMGQEARSLPTGPAVGGLSPGIDAAVTSYGKTRSIVDEFKVVSDFGGKLESASAANLGSTKVFNLRSFGLYGPKATQFSNSWILDRAIGAYRYATGPEAAALSAEAKQTLANDARRVISEFSEGRLQRRLFILNEDGNLFVAHEEALAALHLDEAADLNTLKQGARLWLAVNPQIR